MVIRTLYRRSNTRSFALRALGFSAISAAVAAIAPPPSTLPVETFPHVHMGALGGQVHGF